MATKKQKRAAALAKREQFLRRERNRGLEAQMRDPSAQEHRAMVTRSQATRIKKVIENDGS